MENKDIPSDHVPYESLTQRETEILTLVASGLSNRKIAETLFIAHSTVRWYLRQIYSKLGVEDRDQAISFALNLGLNSDEVILRINSNLDKDSVGHVSEITSEQIDERYDASQTPRFDISTNILQRPKHNLPVQMTSFVGRTAELQELSQLIQDVSHRLITIVASGGMGKTRLALETASYVLDLFANGVYFVELAPLSDPSNIVSVIADAIGVEFSADKRDDQQQLLEFLQDKAMLLVMDNFEHLLDGVGLVNEILQTAPSIQILATSRQRLNQSSETLFHLGGMDFPDWEASEDALEYSVVKLFMQSAKRIQTDFELQAHDLDAVARICVQVQGMPLAILLAASWLEMLTLEEIATEIGENIDFLETEITDIPERQRSIRAMFEYSWNLLSDDEQAVLMKLSIFRGGFTREAVQTITGAKLRSLMSLISKSLLQRNKENGRYEIHELLRQFSKEALIQHRLQNDINHQHMRYYMLWLASLDSKLKGSGQLIALKQITQDLDNVAMAWKNAVQQHEGDLLLDSMDALNVYFKWIHNEPRQHELARLAIEGFTDQRQQFDRLWAQLLLDFHHLLPDSLHDERDNRYNIALAVANKYQDKSLEARIYYQRSFDAYENWGGETSEYTKLAQTIYQEIDDVYWMAQSLMLQNNSRDYEDHTLKVIVLLESLGDQLEIADCFFKLAIFYAFRKGEWEKGKIYSQLAYDTAHKIGLESSICLATSMLGWVALFEGDFEAVRIIVDETIAVSMVNAATWGPYTQLSAIYTFTDDPDKGYELGMKALETTGNSFGKAVPKSYLAYARCGQGRYYEATQLAYDRLAGTPGVAKYDTLAVYILYYEHVGRFDKATRLLNFLVQAPIPFKQFEIWSEMADIRERLKQKMGEEAFNQAWAEGESLDLDTVVKELIDEFGTVSL